MPELSDEETRALIDYARRKFAEQRWPMSPGLRPVREIKERLNPKPEPQPLPAPGKRVRPELADGEEAEAVALGKIKFRFRRSAFQPAPPDYRHGVDKFGKRAEHLRLTRPGGFFTLHRTLPLRLRPDPSSAPVAPGAVALRRERPIDELLPPLALVQRRPVRWGCLRWFGRTHRRRVRNYRGEGTLTGAGFVIPSSGGKHKNWMSLPTLSNGCASATLGGGLVGRGGLEKMPVETDRNATVEWLTWAVSLEGSGSFGVEPPTLHSTFEAAQAHMLHTARELFAQAAVDPDELRADPKPDDWVVIAGSSGEAHGFYWDCHHHYVRSRFIVVRPRRAGQY